MPLPHCSSVTTPWAFNADVQLVACLAAFQKQHRGSACEQSACVGLCRRPVRRLQHRRNGTRGIYRLRPPQVHLHAK